MRQVFEYLVNYPLKNFAKYIYDELYKCDSPIKLVCGTFKRDSNGKVIYEEEKSNITLSWETFWRENVRILLLTNGENPIKIAEYSFGNISFSRFSVPASIGGGPYTFGDEIITNYIFGCNGEIDQKEYAGDYEVVQFVSQFLNWTNKSKYLPNRWQKGLQVSLIIDPHLPLCGKIKGGPLNENDLPSQSAVIAFYNPSVNVLNILAKLFTDALNSVKSQLVLWQTHFGYPSNTGIGRWDRQCGWDLDTVADWTNDESKWYTDPAQPYIIKFGYGQEYGYKSYLAKLYPKCEEEDTGGSGDSGKGSGKGGGKGGSKKEKGASSQPQTQQFPLWLFLIPVVLLVLFRIKGR